MSDKEKSIQPNELILATQIVARVRAEFLLTLARTDAEEKIPKPRSLNIAKKLRRDNITALRREKNWVDEHLKARTQQILTAGRTSSRLEALDLAAQSLLTQSRLSEQGATFGDRPINFCVDPVKFPSETLKATAATAVTGFQTLKDCHNQLPALSPPPPKNVSLVLISPPTPPELILFPLTRVPK